MSDSVVTSDAAGVPSDGTPAAAPVQDNKGDFEARIKTDPEFALQQVKEAQRKLTQYQSKFGGDVEKVVDVLGGKQGFLNYVQRAHTLLNNPTMKPVIEEFERTGRLPTPTAGTANADAAGDEYEEPWTRDLRQRESEIASLRTELNSLRGERGVEKVQGFIAKFEQSMGLNAEESSELREKLIEHANQWGSTAQGLDVLKTMNFETFRSLALGKLTDDQIEAAALRRAQSRAGQRAAAATDVPGGVRTQARGDAAPAGLSPKDAFIEACRQFGQDPWKPLL